MVVVVAVRRVEGTSGCAQVKVCPDHRTPLSHSKQTQTMTEQAPRTFTETIDFSKLPSFNRVQTPKKELSLGTNGSEPVVQEGPSCKFRNAVDKIPLTTEEPARASGGLSLNIITWAED